MQISRLALRAATLLAAALGVTSAPSDATRNRVLVVLNAASERAQYSTYLADLEGRGFAVTVKGAEEVAALVAFEELAFHHLVMLNDNKSGSALAATKVVDFVNRGGNVILAASSKVSEAIRDVGIELSADFDEKGNAVFDAFNSVDIDGDGKPENAVVRVSRVVGDTVIIPPSLKEAIKSGSSPLVFKGVGHRLTGKNPLIAPLIQGNPTSFSYLESTKGKTAPSASAIVGHNLVLVSALQARNNARVVFSGSVELFSNQFFDLIIESKRTSNREFASELTKWVFQEKGVLAVRKTYHHRPTETQQHGSYRIKEDVVYVIEISDYHSNKWHPYKSTTPVQFYAKMLDPYVRQNMTLASVSDTSATYTLPFLTPDVYGVFTFGVEHKRREGYSWIDVHENVNIHPFRHDEYPRFLSAAYPYYVNVFSMMAGFVVLSAVVLYNKEVLPASDKVKKE
ncbi:Dolichyl-diphosphooligosaccharide--protein glycosyltransferase subunit WBP1 [Chytriomyces sp. MP71]|nr:Dolichyl-diphosphooligosaccharide--protein glycosyltransferase subunit WBP1 [Chytriomyces sp. MP71]